MIGSVAHAENRLPRETLYLGFETERELLGDLVSQLDRYRSTGHEGLAERRLAIEPGRFGNCLHIEDGSPISRGTWNESGLDCDLVVAVLWGEWHKKPHYWGAGAFHRQRGTVAFWVKPEIDRPGIAFLQGSIAWGRKERDLLTVEVDAEGKLHAHLRDVRSQYHRVAAGRPTWRIGQWQHVAVVYDRAYGMKLYHNGQLIGSTWGQDAWWQTPLPGLFSLFQEQAYYDELRMFDVPLADHQIASLYRENSVGAQFASKDAIEPAARQRLLDVFGDIDRLELPTAVAGPGTLAMKQIDPASCRDGSIPADWVLDGRYELAWPHPYRLFTFILGDADYHGTKVDLELPTDVKPNHIALEGSLDDVQVLPGVSGAFSTEPLVTLRTYKPFFYARRIDLGNADSLRLPFVRDYGSPEGLQGSARMPRTGSTRIHEIHLWHVEQRSVRSEPSAGSITWHFAPSDEKVKMPRYAPALAKFADHAGRVVLSRAKPPEAASRFVAQPLQPVYLVSPTAGSDMAVDALQLRLLVEPRGPTDVLWLKLRDPSNPARIWAQTCLRVQYPSADGPQPLSIELDIIDLMLGAEDRILLELISAGGQAIHIGHAAGPSSITALLSSDRAKSLAAYARHEMRPARMQYMKQYNYRPWRFTHQSVDLRTWPVFGGPFDMAYPTLAVLRHDPDNRLAKTYHTLLFERNWFGTSDEPRAQRPAQFPRLAGVPEWAFWQRELVALNRRVTDWIASQQRDDGMFWGGANDDPFIPLGWAAMPLLGNQTARRSWLRFYEGLEELGIFHDGYCDIWPIDPLHITDYVTSRGLMLSFSLGDPQVFERELRTAERYTERVAATDSQRAAKGLAPLSGEGVMRTKEEAGVVEQMEAEIRNYSLAHLKGYWGETPTPAAHQITDRAALVNQMKQIVQKTDETALFGFTEARVHTDNQGIGIGRDILIRSALGGRVQGRAEPFSTSIAASWEGVETEDLARLVFHADDAQLAVNLVNFRGEPIDVILRVWRLTRGLYRVRIGPDIDDDGQFDGDAVTDRQTRLARFATLPLSIPPRQNTLLRIERIGDATELKPLPDLAISEKDVVVHTDGRVGITVHNIGAAEARQIVVAMTDGEGKVTDSQIIDRLGSPSADLAARRTTVVFQRGGNRQGGTIVVDKENHIEEIVEENNRTTLYCPNP
ncbi:MAG: LamG-like jellyroll fold domain-containing protein [Pirellulales bacterium]